MKTRFRTIFIVLILIVFYKTSASKGYNQREDRYGMLPQQIENLIKDSLENYSLPIKEQFIDEWKSYGYISTPMLATSDFNGDSKNDYAVILLSKERNKTLLAVFLTNKDSFVICKIKTFDINESLIDVFISVEKKGYWENINGKTHIKYDGICVDWASASLSFNYYWENNSFHRFFSD
jgi:hypothetical protein